MRPITAYRYAFQSKIKRARTAWAFFRNRVTEVQAYDLIIDVQDRLGSWPLACIETEWVVERLRDKYQDSPELLRLAYQAAQRVYNKWSDDIGISSVAVDWAVDLVEEYAKDEGIILSPILE